MDLFNGRKLVIGSMHKKEEVICPLLEKDLGVQCVIPKNLNTDIFGTFTGEIKRKGDMVEAARGKLLKAMKMSGCDLGVASEGSFGMHPSIPFIASNFELILFIDTKNNLEITGHYRSTETNLDGEYISSTKEALDFAQKIGFPKHGVIIRRKKEKNIFLYKNISTQEELETGVQKILSLPFTSKAFIETDMRAHRNPTRMKVIYAATKNLIENIYSCCPKCHMPGFVITGIEGKLCCSRCGSHTDIPKYEVYSCTHCQYSENRVITEYGESAEPGHCGYCNP